MSRDLIVDDQTVEMNIEVPCEEGEVTDGLFGLFYLPGYGSVVVFGDYSSIAATSPLIYVASGSTDYEDNVPPVKVSWEQVDKEDPAELIALLKSS